MIIPGVEKLYSVNSRQIYFKLLGIWAFFMLGTPGQLYFGYTSPDFVRKPTRIGSTTASSPNVRTGPGKDYQVMTQLPKRSRVNVISGKEGWYAIEFPRNFELSVTAKQGLEGPKKKGNLKKIRTDRIEYAGRCDRRSGSIRESEPGVGRVAHGIPARIHRIKALGNAIVPQVAQVIMEGIRNIIITTKQKKGRE